MASKLKTSVSDHAEHLKTEEDIAAYPEAAFDEGDPSLIASPLGGIARA
jgi:DNA-binding phage protein